MAHYDICIIGAGSGGLTVAAAAAQFGQKVCLIEKGEMGGDCLNVGCVPSKALLAAAKRAHAMRSAEAFGIAPVEPEIDFKKVRRHLQQVIAAIEPNDSQERFEKLGVKVIRAAARFAGPDRIEAGGENITARRFVVATGSRPVMPPVPGLAEVPYFTNETIFANDRRPEHLMIIGAGPVGLEMAQAHRRLGAKVTVIEAADPLSNDDPELTQIVLKQLAAEGINILSRTSLMSVEKTKSGIVLAIEGAGGVRSIAGSHILVAAGRKPNVDGLGLEAAGIAYSARGIVVDSGLRTSNRKVYAIGDVAGGPQFTHRSSHHAKLVLKNALFRLPVKTMTDIIPRVTYTDPELAQVGLSEAEARRRHGDGIAVLRRPFHDNDRAQTERKIQGLVKVIAGKRGKILGVGIVGADAGELIGPWSLAISGRLRLKAFADAVFPYPTLGEINKRAAISYYADLATKPWVRRVIRLLAYFG